MATELPTIPVNGNYAPHQGYGGLDQAQVNQYPYPANGGTPSQAPAVQPPPTSTTPAAATAGSSTTPQPDVPKDEVGWYFVEQYYTTLSRSPEKLYLFYNKRSQFVSGQETDKVSVCVGQRAINDRIKELDFQDCKVRVTNVDSQASDSNIVIQVIGEISNKSQPHKKFTQTFVLATQTNGYFVLNDIFRYLIDEEEEAGPELDPVEEEIPQVPVAEGGYQEPVPTATEVEPKGLTSSSDPAAVEHDAQQVDKELETKVLHEQPEAEDEPHPPINGIASDEPEAEPAEAVSAPEPEAAVVDATNKEETAEEEKPAAPEQTPAVSPPKAVTPQPAPAPKPAAPKSWASMAASANRVATPASPSPASSNNSQPKAAPSGTKPTGTTTSTAPTAPAAVQTPSTPTAPAAERDDSPAEGSQGEEWTAVGGSHNRQQSRQANTRQETPLYRGYIKNVYETVDGNELKSHLEQYGELLYFDIARQKNCAFVDFKTLEGYNAAVNANPHLVSGERLNVEERHVRPGSTPYVPRGQYQGNRGGRGTNQGGAQRGNYRGGYAPRAARGGTAPRGQGRSQAT